MSLGPPGRLARLDSFPHVSRSSVDAPMSICLLISLTPPLLAPPPVALQLHDAARVGKLAAQLAEFFARREYARDFARMRSPKCVAAQFRARGFSAASLSTKRIVFCRFVLAVTLRAFTEASIILAPSQPATVAHRNFLILPTLASSGLRAMCIGAFR